MAGQKSNTSRRTRLRSAKFDENIEKRGKVVAQSTAEVFMRNFFSGTAQKLPFSISQKRDNNPTVSPLLLGFIFFVLVGR